MSIPTRLCIYPKDIARITGKSERYARKLIQLLREEFAKQPHQPITVHDFSAYSGIPVQDIQPYLID
ncbi:MAG: hypothetical protein N4A41_08040 [Crocinitomicaceae bacterium]|jgi:hypothetical protein|nr:hypothetical protein [Crocinitomicaceae bacterium]